MISDGSSIQGAAQFSDPLRNLKIPRGQVIREAWAKYQTALHGAGDTSSFSSSPSSWNIRRSVVEYKGDGGTALQGLYARPEGEGLPGRLPGVIIAHTAVGPQEGTVPISRRGDSMNPASDLRAAESEN